MDLWKDNNLKAGEIGDSGEWDFGLTSSFWKWYIYIYFLSGSLNVCFIALLLKQMFLFAVLPTVKTNEGHSLNAAVKKKKKSQSFSVLLSLFEGACGCVWVCVSPCLCAYIQSVIWNYFWQRRSILIAFFLLVLKKRSSCSIFACLQFSLDFLLYLCFSWTSILLFILMLLLHVEVKRQSQETRNGTGSHSQSVLMQELSTRRLWLAG